MDQTRIGFFFCAALLCFAVVVAADDESSNGNSDEELFKPNPAFQACVLAGKSWEECLDSEGNMFPFPSGQGSMPPGGASHWRWGGIWSPTPADLFYKSRSK